MRLHRVPESIVLDYNTKFMLTFWHELHKLMGTKLLMSTAFHPQMDGTTEQANCSIGQILRMIIQDDQKDWAAKFPMVEFVLNSNASNNCVKDCLHKDHCTQAFGRNTLSKPHTTP